LPGSQPPSRFSLLAAAALALAAPASDAQADDRDSVLTAALAASAPRIDPNAAAEVLTWDVTVSYLFSDAEVWSIAHHRLVTRVFRDEGREPAGLFEFMHDDDVRIEGVSGRTVRADGSVVPLQSSEVRERDVLGEGRDRIRHSTVALPAVEAGAVTELRWTEMRRKTGWIHDEYPFQRSLPVHRTTVRVTPLNVTGVPGFRWRLLDSDAPTAWDRGTLVVTARDVPAFAVEPDAPPPEGVMPRLSVYYASLASGNVDELWGLVGKALTERDADDVRAPAVIASLARETVAGEADPARQALRLAHVARARVRNLESSSTTTQDEWRRAARQDTPEDCLKSGIGTGAQINSLLAALATGAGLESRIAYAPSSSDGPFDPRSGQFYGLVHPLAAIRIAGAWRLYDPGTPDLPVDMLSWRQESMPVFVPEATRSSFVTAPVAPSGRSCRIRVADLGLAEDGTLEGEVSIRHTGHFAAASRETAGESEESRTKWIAESLRDELPDGAISEVRVTGLAEPESAVVARFRLRVPSYAEASAQRLFLQPALQHGAPPRYPAAERHHPLWYRHAWSEVDTIRIRLPGGAVASALPAPTRIPFGPFGEYAAAVETSPGRIEFRRLFRLERTRFERDAYPAIRQAFVRAAEFDRSTVEIQRVGSSP